MKLTIKLTGLKEFIAKLIRKKQSIKRNLEVALDNIGKMVVEKAREYVPEDSGQLKSDIEYKVGRNFVDIGVPRSAKVVLMLILYITEDIRKGIKQWLKMVEECLSPMQYAI